MYLKKDGNEYNVDSKLNYCNAMSFDAKTKDFFGGQKCLVTCTGMERRFLLGSANFEQSMW